MAGSSLGSKSLKEYLKKYESNNEDENKKKKKKKKQQKAKPDASGVLVVDEDPVWQKPVQLEEDQNDSAEEEKPQIDEDIEVRRMRRLEHLRAIRASNPISEDGSGWVTLSPKHANLNSDLSPPRKHTARNDTPSPELKPSEVDNDFSPPRQRRTCHHTPSPEPDNQNSDLSPPRNGRARNDTPSPERDRKPVKEIVDLSPPRQWRRRHHTQSPEPDKGHVALDLSPPRKSRNDDLSPPRKNTRQVSALDMKEERKTGLITGRDMRDEIARTKKQDLMRFQDMDPSISGRGAEPIYRDKIKGVRITKEEFLKSKQKVEEKPKEIKLEWGKGLAQKREAEAKLQELELEKDKPFARTRDDPEIDKLMKERIRWGDPMAHLVKKKQFEPALSNFGDSEKMKESGFIIPQDIPNHSWLKRGLDAAPNRYGIRPGRHWDGVDRSTGYEKELFKRKNEKQATEREAYLWSVADM
ncbi:uncharacterized protein LOC133834562 [Humulus lupulus]|uniref:uncharacterized protein LOC133834562 n=1 Tax=Humulus lupulus TaxID=3486 RepID=UPI002B411B91|nr:uncharacterized protein LOC133834562 [Humulus lupulus]XP_062120197.1 uncharacterized protein LOC133834562 [Humulus lupulus]XP_062120198.1 uncharacterized protein LOC133834562 [Humulus lupulus]